MGNWDISLWVIATCTMGNWEEILPSQSEIINEKKYMSNQKNIIIHKIAKNNKN